MRVDLPQGVRVGIRVSMLLEMQRWQCSGRLIHEKKRCKKHLLIYTCNYSKISMNFAFFCHSFTTHALMQLFGRIIFKVAELVCFMHIE